MTKLNRLIEELCPNGVEFKRVKEVYKRLKGTPITAGKMKDVVSLERNGITLCMECGSCAYNCPAHRPLVQTMRQGKALVKSAPKK